MGYIEDDLRQLLAAIEEDTLKYYKKAFNGIIDIQRYYVKLIHSMDPKKAAELQNLYSEYLNKLQDIQYDFAHGISKVILSIKLEQNEK